MERQRPRTERQCNPSVAHGFFFPDVERTIPLDTNGTVKQKKRTKAHHTPGRRPPARLPSATHHEHVSL
jgi:hypothetical protein